jgi:drug/metabolite transporter (DMT)-like permease
VVGVLVGLAGLVTLFNPLTFDWSDRAVVLGNLAILAGALLWAASILHIRAHRWRSTPFALIPWETLLATVLLAPLALAAGPPTLPSGLPGSPCCCSTWAPWAPRSPTGRWRPQPAAPAVTTSLGLLATPVVSDHRDAWLGEPLTLQLVSRSSVLGGVAIGATHHAAAGRGAT